KHMIRTIRQHVEVAPFRSGASPHCADRSYCQHNTSNKRNYKSRFHIHPPITYSMRRCTSLCLLSSFRNQPSSKEAEYRQTECKCLNRGKVIMKHCRQTRKHVKCIIYRVIEKHPPKRNHKRNVARFHKT